MAIFKKLSDAFPIIVAALLMIAIIASGLYYARRMTTSDRLWIGTKIIGIHLQEYARDHGGRFPANLEDTDFTSMLDAEDRNWIQSLHPEYRQPQVHEKNPVKLLVAESKWETVTLYSDGNVEGTER